MRFKGILALLLIGIFARLGVSQQPAPISPNFDAAALLHDIEVLSADDMEGREIGTPGIKKARQYILQRFAARRLTSFSGGYVMPFKYRGKMAGANIVGYIEGSSRKNEYILISAHYDHLGVRSGTIYNGADDNASGTAALIALAEYFAKNKPAHSIVFAAFDGEEKGLKGSKDFASTPPVDIRSILVDVNMDMISRSEKNELYVVGTRQYPVLKPYLDEVAASAKIKLVLGHDGSRKGGEDWTSQSDHYPFHKKGIPFVYFGVEDHPDYHKPTDDFANIDPAFYVQAVEVVLNTIKLFDKNLGGMQKK